MRKSVTSTSISSLKDLQVSDIRGFAQLATHATAGVTRIVEDLHLSVLDTLDFGRPAAPGLTRKITGVVYKTIHQLTQLAGTSADITLTGLQTLLGPGDANKPKSVQREAVLAILNGIMGDHLHASNNAFAVPMSFRHQGLELDPKAMPALPAASGKVLLLIHGLCKSDLRQTGAQSSDLGEVLASELGYTPVYLRYNSGLHVSQNGRELSVQLEQLLKQWPTEIEELTIVAHSMGGLVARSAQHYATQASLLSAARFKNIVFLGTPHHGAPLERAGNWVDELLESTPYSRPFAALGKLRSAGITDLRTGSLLDDDWCDQGRFHRKSDRREVVPLPNDVACYTVAALAARQNNPVTRLFGDGLVPLQSALGWHHESQRVLKFEEKAQHIAHGVNHMGLLNSPEVKRHILQWLAKNSGDSCSQRMAN